ncbi:hypothetical protein GCM10027176_66130 [Actinoallomurus bryophytorum]|uniref:Uncharacterized protein n=1 Tax=Actinoallomurus bryophytorum TaxID=1490222 RepID=A0A543BZB0_9ACTN|nr:hypothetical protein [Actinoallomurus bryophytorum]TQL90162.1 hypothetical protein FB559_7455 [Actinoallomurus bryophytorum]
MLVDPHGLLRPELAERVHVHKDELALVLSLLPAPAQWSPP